MVKASDILLCLVAILFPPAAAAFVAGCCSCDMLINICLTLLGYIPGHIHAFWLIYKQMKAEEEFGQGQYMYIGSGQYVAVDGAVPVAGVQPPNYGAAGNAA